MTEIEAGTRVLIWALATAHWWMANECQMQNRKVNQWTCYMEPSYKLAKQNCCVTFTKAIQRVANVNRVSWVLLVPFQALAKRPVPMTTTNGSWKIWKNVMDCRMKVNIQTWNTNPWNRHWSILRGRSIFRICGCQNGCKKWSGRTTTKNGWQLMRIWKNQNCIAQHVRVQLLLPAEYSISLAPAKVVIVIVYLWMLDWIRSIPSENKGFKMLSKLGWSQGQALGRNNDGLLEPVSVTGFNENTKSQFPLVILNALFSSCLKMNRFHWREMKNIKGSDVEVQAAMAVAHPYWKTPSRSIKPE